MGTFHIVCEITGIYAGTFKWGRIGKWRRKSDVTTEAMVAVATYFLSKNKEFRFKDLGGQWYVMKAEKMDATGAEVDLAEKGGAADR